MLCLLFQLGDDRYALDTSSVEEVLPVVHWKEIPRVATGVLGLFDYHGDFVPLIDLSHYILGRPAVLHMSTRIVLHKYQEEGVAERLLGLLVEAATFTFHVEPAEFAPAGVEVGTAPYLGPVIADNQGIVQLIEVKHLLPSDVKTQLFLQADHFTTENVADRVAESAHAVD